MTPLLALLPLGLLSVESPENYFTLIFILPNSYLKFALKFISALKFCKTLFQLLFTISSIYIFHLAITPNCKYFMHSGISKLVPLLHTT